ncbi:hypothetical protein GF391_04250 [Candidatus Uhrbacteria bacterium]|nr:hypothetical protein [Candidatus Uhrbacteria bacterium]
MRKFKVTKKDCVTEDLCRVWMAPADGEGMFDFKPGQFVMIHEMNEEGQSVYVRSYSIASAPYESSEDFELGVKAQGRMSNLLFGAKSGDVFGVQGPYGMFKMSEDEKVVFFAGGVGITPFRSMIRNALRVESQKRLTLFYSGRTRNDLLYNTEFVSLANEYDNFTYVPILTREDPPEWKGEKGRLSRDMVGKYVEDFDAGYLMCGPVEMMDHVKEILEQNGVDVKIRLRAERY